MQIQAYFENWALAPGDKVQMAISSSLGRLDAKFQRLLSSSGDPQNPSDKRQDMTGVLDTSLDVLEQRTFVGSYGHLPFALPLAEEFTFHCRFMPTNSKLLTPQVICSMGDSEDNSLVLQIIGGILQLKGGKGLLQLGQELIDKEWYSVVIGIRQDDAVLEVRQTSSIQKIFGNQRESGLVGKPAGSGVWLASASLLKDGSPNQCFSGKIENPKFILGSQDPETFELIHMGAHSSLNILAEWDFSQLLKSDELMCVNSSEYTGTLMNGAERGVTGHNWSGKYDSFLTAPGEYGAVYFHDDEMLDSNWDYNLTFNLPTDLESGVYCVTLSSKGSSSSFPIFVRSLKKSRAKALLLFPTYTYVAYANGLPALFDVGLLTERKIVMTENERFLLEHPELGRSCYDAHSDGSPVRYSSNHRPIFNVMPSATNSLLGSVRHFAADLYILDWLIRSGIAFDIATDEDLHREGIGLLESYKTVITGSHPEYVTRQEILAIESYLSNGGRVMYLGGNGFYWVTSPDEDRPWIVEVRRDNSGTRTWDSPVGERTHVFDNEIGGLWRFRGKSPHRTVGIGFGAEGFSGARPYTRQDASYSGPASQWFDEISSTQLGEQGYVLGGAAGDEIDRWDPNLGSPTEVHILASATGFPNVYQIATEDTAVVLPDQGGPFRPDRVRADMIYYTIQGGGAVFSVGSICYAGSLAWNNFDNDLSTITTRVLESFCTNLPE